MVVDIYKQREKFEQFVIREIEGRMQATAIIRWIRGGWMTAASTSVKKSDTFRGGTEKLYNPAPISWRTMTRQWRQ